MKIKLLHKNAKLPKYESENAAGLDLCAMEDGNIGPHQRAKVSTGIAVQIPIGYVGLLFARSGNAWKYGVSLANAVGVIDADYRGEICALLTNHDSQKPFIYKAGDRIAQLVILPVATVANFEVVDELDSTERGEEGFGHTGK